jgi:hypothetical protein
MSAMQLESKVTLIANVSCYAIGLLRQSTKAGHENEKNVHHNAKDVIWDV